MVIDFGNKTLSVFAQSLLLFLPIEYVIDSSQVIATFSLVHNAKKCIFDNEISGLIGPDEFVNLAIMTYKKPSMQLGKQ